METILNFINDVLNTLKENPHLFWIVVGCVGALLILIVLLIVLNAKNKAVEEEDETKLIKETLRETVEESTPVEEPVVEVVEEPVVEEPTPIAEPVVEVEEQQQPVVEELAPVEEAAPVEETPAEPAPKKTTRKKAVKTEEPAPVEEPTPVVEETPAETKKARVVYGKYEVYSDGTAFYYNLKASNGEVLIKSESYASKESVLAALEAINRNVEVGTISVRQDKHGLYQFALVARNNRTLVLSANYPTSKRAESASNSFKRFAAISPIVEQEIVVEPEREEVTPNREINKQGGKLGVVEIDGSYHYILKASNGEPLVRSTSYKSELTATAALERFKDAVKTGKFYIDKDKRGKYQFKLYSSAGRLVIVGESYGSKNTAVSSVHSVCSFVEFATPIHNVPKTE